MCNPSISQEVADFSFLFHFQSALYIINLLKISKLFTNVANYSFPWLFFPVEHLSLK